MRGIAGGLMLVTALAIATSAVEPLQRITPAWLEALSERVENDDDVRSELDALAGRERATGPAGTLTFDECARSPGVLADCGTAPELVGITGWLNTDPVTLADLRGQVVLLDFWTYSCINCQRTLPYLVRWADEYADDGLVVLGVHSPEFAFERVERNVADNARRLGVTYPIALDSDFTTWRAYDQRYWPAHYLIDAEGTVRQVHYGEGAYAETEALIRELLGVDGAGAGPVEDYTLTQGRTPELYLGGRRLAAIENNPVTEGEPARYLIDDTPDRDAFSLGGTWDIQPEYAEAGADARLSLHFRAAQVHLVLAGEGTVTVTLAGDPQFRREVSVMGTPALYTLYDDVDRADVLRLEISGGLAAYAFTFG